MIAHDAVVRTREGPWISEHVARLSQGTCVVGGQGNANCRKAQRPLATSNPPGSEVFVAHARAGRHGVCLTRLS